MNGEARQLEVVNPVTGKTVKIKVTPLLIGGVNHGPLFDVPTAYPCPENAIGKVFCGNCKHCEDANIITPVFLDNELLKENRYEYCKFGRILIYYKNSACIYHSKFDEDRTDQYGLPKSAFDYSFDYDEKLKIIDLRNDLTDIGNAHRFVDRHQKDVRYCHVWGKWLIWDETRWSIDTTGEAERRAKETIYSIYLEAADPDINKKRRGDLVDWAQKSEKNSSIKSLLEIASSEPNIIIKHDELDVEKYLLNTKNATIDLHNKYARRHMRKDYITKVANVEYNKYAKHERWTEFLKLVFNDDKDTISFVQKALGYSLSGDTGEQCVFILWGAGENGKSTFLDTIYTILGDYADNCQPETFMVREYNNGANNDIAKLKGARFVTSVETEEGRKLAESLLKQMTGGDVVSARFLHKEFFNFKPEFKLWFCTQHRPVISGTDRGIWRRIRLIPFNTNVPNKLKELDKDRRPIKNYHETLIKEEASGILNWMLEGFQLYLKEGLEMSKSIQDAVNDYKAEMDVIGRFIEENCIIKSDISILYKDLYERYIIWCNNNNERPLGTRKFSTRMLEKGFVKKAGTDNKKFWHGITLRITELPKITDLQDCATTCAKHKEKPEAQVMMGNSVISQNEQSKLKLPQEMSVHACTDKPLLILEKQIKDTIEFLNMPSNKGAIFDDIIKYTSSLGFDAQQIETKLRIMVEIGEIIKNGVKYEVV